MSGKVSHGNTPAAWIGTVVLLVGALLVSFGVVVHWSWLWIAGAVLLHDRGDQAGGVALETGGHGRGQRAGGGGVLGHAAIVPVRRVRQVVRRADQLSG